MASQIVDCSQSKLILSTFIKFLVILHQVFLIIFFMSEVEKKPGL